MQKVLESLHESAPLIGGLGTSILIIVGVALVGIGRNYISRPDLAKASKWAGWTSLGIVVGSAVVDAGIASIMKSIV